MEVLHRHSVVPCVSFDHACEITVCLADTFEALAGGLARLLLRLAVNLELGSHLKELKDTRDVACSAAALEMYNNDGSPLARACGGPAATPPTSPP